MRKALSEKKLDKYKAKTDKTKHLLYFEVIFGFGSHATGDITELFFETPLVLQSFCSKNVGWV